MSPTIVVFQCSKEEVNNRTNKCKINTVATAIKRQCTAPRNPKWET